jgi:hypothetical protein
MDCVTSMWDFLFKLLRDQHAQEEFRHNPVRVLHEHGLQHITASDVHDLTPLVTDHPGVQFSGDHGFSSPPPIFPAPGESETHCAIRHIEHFTKCYTYNIDNHNTVIDDSVHQNIWAEGDVNQTFDDTNVVASGHAVAAGGGIWGSAVTTGDENAVGTGDAVGLGNVTGNDNALGAGSVAGYDNTLANGYGSTIGDQNTVANGYGSAAGQDNSVINGSHDVQGNGNVTGPVIGSQVATTGGTIANGNHLVGDSGNTDLHGFGVGSIGTIGSDNISATAINSGDSSDSHNGTHFDHGFGNGAMGGSMSGSDDENGTHFGHHDHDFDHHDHDFDHGDHDFDHHDFDFDHHGHDFDHHAEGDSYGDNSLHGNCDPHDSPMELHIP